jgi:B9 domain-containing protein 2
MAEVHFVGQILGGTGFPAKGLLCKVGIFPCILSQLYYCSVEFCPLQWDMEASEDTWDLLEGFDQGQTHTSWPQDGGKAVWAHPIDIHYQCLVRKKG